MLKYTNYLLHKTTNNNFYRSNHNNQPHKRIQRILGFTLFEIVIALIVGSIILSISGALIVSAIQTAANTAKDDAIGVSTENSAPTQSTANIALSILTNDFTNNQGNVKIKEKGDRLELSFKFPRPDDPTKTTNVVYTCDFSEGKLYREIPSEETEVLLEQVTACNFASMVSPDNAYITLTTDITVNGSNNLPIVLFDETVATYEKGKQITTSSTGNQAADNNTATDDTTSTDNNITTDNTATASNDNKDKTKKTK